MEVHYKVGDQVCDIDTHCRGGDQACGIDIL